MKRGWLIAGIGLLAVLWLVPWPGRHSFAMHMAVHMGVVAVAAPLLAAAIANGPLDPARRRPRGWMAAAWWPLFASAVEFVVVWGWHVPGLHLLARHEPFAYVLEQVSFLGAGVLLWLAALGQGAAGNRERAGAGALALLLTATHMTLLGVLLATANRVLYVHGSAMAGALWDQQLGGVLMLAIGGVAYLAGALVLLLRLLDRRDGVSA